MQVALAQSAEAGVVRRLREGMPTFYTGLARNGGFPLGFTASTRLRTIMKKTKKQQPRSLMKQGRRIRQREASVWPQWNPSPMPLLRKCFSQNMQSQGLPHLNLFLSRYSQSSVNEGPATVSAIAFTTKIFFPSLSLSLSVPFCLIYTEIPFNLNIVSNKIT